MSNGIFKVPTAVNEPILSYAPGSVERAQLEKKIKELKTSTLEIPLIIGGKEVRTGQLGKCRIPHDHQHDVGIFHQAGEKEVRMAIKAAEKAWETWSEIPWEDRVAIFKRMALLLSTDYRSVLNAATMLGQSKSVYQAEIDSACELIDFFNFNAHYLYQIYRDQPLYNTKESWNRLEYRPLEGFIFAVTPFNFTSIAGNLPTSPALMGNTVLWKPASTAVYSAYFLMQLFKEAGLPDGVINFIPGKGSHVGKFVLEHDNLAGIHFTGSTAVFQNMWKTVGTHITIYKTYPRIVGETGGKDFIFAHESADPDELITALVRGAFEYQGQKCSAASRAYIPKSLWHTLKDKYIETVNSIPMGDPTDFKNFMGAVIDEAAFTSITKYIDLAKESSEANIITGGGYDRSKGWFIEPTTILTTNPKFVTMEKEIFGPVLTIFIYDNSAYEETLALCNETSPYGLTGAIFGKDRSALRKAETLLRHAAGNFYINDKPTGAVVGQQPFGGSRASGTNDKAGSPANLMRWVSMRTIKENFLPPKNYRYPHMD
ncbi:MAG: L-glutamate gamma-semialdehyde dehydrogenase [Candidatus Marinimicrobia bacterium]|nr:L-glutamate gamma-semialdehyde dehydrogenase [Candidatus Neomarinimicrobiota bacterium]MDD5582870.1 L-glutamate gamma-semialdehyde dehydrogenase [Candidatus Neomarinimicrobiota bacterium]